jgi:hypothetical protein
MRVRVKTHSDFERQEWENRKEEPEQDQTQQGKLKSYSPCPASKAHGDMMCVSKGLGNFDTMALLAAAQMASLLAWLSSLPTGLLRCPMFLSSLTSCGLLCRTVLSGSACTADIPATHWLSSQFFLWNLSEASLKLGSSVWAGSPAGEGLLMSFLFHTLEPVVSGVWPIHEMTPVDLLLLPLISSETMTSLITTLHRLSWQSCKFFRPFSSAFCPWFSLHLGKSNH